MKKTRHWTLGVRLGRLWGPHCRKLLITTYSEDLIAILFSWLIAFVECCVAVPANRIGLKTMTLEQGIRYLSREEKVRHITGRPRKVVKRLIVPG